MDDRRRRILLVCCGFARNLAIYRCGQGVGRVLLDKEGDRGFWREVNSSCLDIAVLEWCKLFADQRGKHSWRRVVAPEMHAAFERGLLAAMGTDPRKFTEYLGCVRAYRD